MQRQIPPGRSFSCQFRVSGPQGLKPSCLLLPGRSAEALLHPRTSPREITARLAVNLDSFAAGCNSGDEMNVPGRGYGIKCRVNVIVDIKVRALLSRCSTESG